MPIYEFVCQDCGCEFEKIQSFSDSSTPACPECQGVHVQRRLSAPAIHFKGSGWYITDSKNSGKSAASGSANGEPGKESGKGEASKEGEAGKSGDGAKSESAKSEGSKADAGSASAAKAATD